MAENELDPFKELLRGMFWEAHYQEHVVRRGLWHSRYLHHLLCTTPIRKEPLINLTVS